MSLFSGLRIIDLTKVFSGPFATRLFADYGAEVIKIEHQSSPDPSRTFAPVVHDWSGYFEILNRGKKSVTLDLKNQNDRQIFFDLARGADLVVENMTPSVKRKLSVDYNDVKAINPTIIYASISGEGQESDRKYFDIIAQAESGLMSLSGTKDHPIKIGPSVVDAFTGLNLAFAISSALWYREKHGAGQYIDVSMIGSAINLLEQNLTEYSVTLQEPNPPANYDTAIAPFGIYPTRTKYIAIAIGSEGLWNKFYQWLCEYIQLDQHLVSTNNLRLQHKEYLNDQIRRITSTQTAQSINDQLTRRMIPCAIVASMADVAKNQSLFDKKYLQAVKINSATDSTMECVVPGRAISFSVQQEDISVYQQAPILGEHNSTYGIHNS